MDKLPLTRPQVGNRPATPGGKQSHAGAGLPPRAAWGSEAVVGSRRTS